MSRSRAVPTADALAKAEVLAEALPWLEEFRGATVVVKYGGNAMVSPELQRSFAEDVVFLRLAGLRPVVVHGGGPQINAMLTRLGVTSEFRAGLRVTTPEIMDIVRMVLTGKVQRDLVGQVNAHGPLAVGISGEDAHLFEAERRTVVADGQDLELGLVGDVTRVRPDFVVSLLDDGFIPVISTIGLTEDGEVLNVNADTAASALAVALGAQKLVVLTDVEGLFADWPDRASLIAEIRARELEEMLATLDSGMAPKMEACLRAVRGGVERAHVIDGRVPHSLMLEIFTSEGIGTMVLADEDPEVPGRAAGGGPQ
jgi:acetylglutamate kinase